MEILLALISLPLMLFGGLVLDAASNDDEDGQDASRDADEA